MIAIAKPHWKPGIARTALLAALCAVGLWTILAHTSDPAPALATSRGAPAGSWASIPLAARGPISAALGRDEAAFRLHGFSANNLAQELDAHFKPGAVSVRSGSLRLTIGFAGIGRGNRLAFARGVVSPARSGQQVLYRHGSLIEAWSNGPDGLEQTFTVTHRPTGIEPLQLDLRVDGTGVQLTGGARAGAIGQAQSITISDRSQSLRYDGLIATDARGHALHAWLSSTGQRIVIHVDDRHATYPIRIDPFVQHSELTTASAAAGSDFGSSVAISGHTIVIGAADQTVSGNSNQGAVYVFTEPAAGWANTTQTAELTASDGGADDNLGDSVAISGNTIVAGAVGHTVNGIRRQGAVYVFTEPASGWANTTQTGELTASDGGAYDNLGDSVAISGNTIVAGAVGHTVNGNANQGAAYVFTEPVAGWANATQTAELTASDGANSDYFGTSVAISGGTIVAGADLHRVGGNYFQGAAYVFTEPVAGWANATQTAELTASDGAEDDDLGSSVAISGNTIVAGAVGHTVNGSANQGAVYVFSEPASGWTTATQTAELTTSDGAAGDYFGTSVAISGDTFIAGSTGHTVNGTANQGATYLFTEPAASKLTGSLDGNGAAGASITIPEASPVSATAALSGVDAAAATGSITYSIYSDSACRHLVNAGTAEPITSPGTLPPSRAISITRPGTYYWQITYSGDLSNIGSQSDCGTLIETVTTSGKATITLPHKPVTGTTLTLPVRCSKAGPCKLKFTLNYRATTVATASLTLRAGKSTKLKLTLNATGKRLLRTHNPLHTTLQITQAGRHIVTATVTFRNA